MDHVDSNDCSPVMFIRMVDVFQKKSKWVWCCLDHGHVIFHWQIVLTVNHDGFLKILSCHLLMMFRSIE
jgi:hypothetical protein